MRVTGYATFEIIELIGDGQTDNTDILQALIDVGNIISLPPGVFLTRQLVVKPGTFIKGVGSGTFVTPSDPSNMSILRLIPDTNADLIVGPPGTSDVKIQDIQLDGSGNTEGSGIVIQDGNSEEAQWKIKRIYIHRFADNGVYIGQQRRCVHLEETVINKVNGQGLVVKGSDAIVDKCSIGQNKLEGIQVLDAAVRIKDCDIFWNQAGIVVAYVPSCIISGNSIDRSMRQGIYLSPNCYGASISSNIFVSNSQDAEGAHPHIDLDGTKHVTIVGNIFSEVAPDAPNKSNYCIYMRPGASVSGMETNVAHENSYLNGFTNLPPEDW